MYGGVGTATWLSAILAPPHQGLFLRLVQFTPVQLRTLEVQPEPSSCSSGWSEPCAGGQSLPEATMAPRVPVRYSP